MKEWVVYFCSLVDKHLQIGEHDPHPNKLGRKNYQRRYMADWDENT